MFSPTSLMTNKLNIPLVASLCSVQSKSCVRGLKSSQSGLVAIAPSTYDKHWTLRLPFIAAGPSHWWAALIIAVDVTPSAPGGGWTGMTTPPLSFRLSPLSYQSKQMAEHDEPKYLTCLNTHTQTPKFQPYYRNACFPDIKLWIYCYFCRGLVPSDISFLLTFTTVFIITFMFVEIWVILIKVNTA